MTFELRFETRFVNLITFNMLLYLLSNSPNQEPLPVVLPMEDMPW